MIFENLWPLTLLSAVPVVIVLYLLKPRGKDYRISSNLLWDRLFRNEQSKTFLEKFIHNILMYLQILILVLLVLALMSPYIHRQGKSGGNVILVFDESGSMQHDAGDGRTRMEQAKEQAKSLIAASEGTAFSIITTDCAGTSALAVGATDKNSLYAALDQIDCCDGSGSLADAETMVETLRSAATEEEEGDRETEVVVFTDGNGAEDAMSFSEYFDARVVVVGDAVRNVSNNFLTWAETSTIEDGAADQASETDSPRFVTCASSLTNYSDASASMEVSLYEGDRLVEIRDLTIDPGETTLCFFEDFEWRGEALRSEISSVKFAGKKDRDSLAADNVAYAIEERTERMDAVLIGEGNTYLEKAYQAAAGMSLTKIAGEIALQDAPQTVCIYDAGTESSLQDSVNAMLFQDGAHSTGTAEKVMLTVSDCELTEGLAPFTIGVNETNVYEVPAWGTGFLWAGGQCAGYYGEHDGVKTVAVGFDIRESDFPLKAEFPVFMANAIHFLGDASLLADNVYEAGEKVVFRPHAKQDPAIPAADTKKAGLYEVTAGEITEQYVVRFAVGSESDGQITAQGTFSDTGYSEKLVKKRLRTGLLVLVFVLMAVEWIVYVRQIRYRGRFYLGVRAVGMLLLILALCGVTAGRRNAANTTIFLVDLSYSNERNLPVMEEYVRDALDRMPKKNQYDIVTFGKNSVVDQFLTKEDHFSQILSLPDKEATNFEDAVSRALAMIPANGAGRIVVLTDGKETTGDLGSMASALLSGQVELLARVYEGTDVPQDVYVENVEMPGYLYQGDLYSMTVTVESSYETDAEIQIWMEEIQTAGYEVHLNKGSNQFRFKQEVTGENVESFEVRVVAAGDGCEENNSYHAYSVVESAPKVLLISGRGEDSSKHENLLRSAGCDFDTVSVAGAPDSLEKLLEYKSILLENVYLSDLPEGFLTNIETCVKDYGCGLVCIGGDDSFALGGYRESVLETVLPVDMELQGINEIPSMAMIMVIDHSGSMSVPVRGRATSLDLAVTAAKTAVDQMRDADYVGVVAFDDRFDWVVEPTPADDKEEIREQMETIAEGGGTTIGPALWAALDGAEDCDVSIRHVILLTDGQGESRNYREIEEAYAAAGVTLSTVAVGKDSDTGLLEQLAENCGGRYYYSDMASEIPKIFAQEVFLSGDTYLQNGRFELAVDGNSEITGGLFEDGWPCVYGYVSATPKQASRVLIASEKDDPLLTVMQYGLGHTVAWNTDVTNEWTADFAGKSDYAQLWRRIVDYSVGSVTIGEDSVDVTTEGGRTAIVYRALDYGEQTKVEAVYTDPAGNTQTQALQATAPGRFEAKLDTDTTGLYNLSVRRLDGGNIINAITTAVAVQYSDEYKFDVDTAAFTGFVERFGALLDPEENFWRQRKSEARERYELTKWLILLLIFWFVMDIVLRRFCFRPQDTRLYRRAVRYRMKRKEKRDRRKTGAGEAVSGRTVSVGHMGGAGANGSGSAVPAENGSVVRAEGVESAGTMAGNGIDGERSAGGMYGSGMDRMSGTGNRGIFSGRYAGATAGNGRRFAQSAADDGAAAAKNMSAEFLHAEASAGVAENRTAEAMNKEISVSADMKTAGKEKKQKKVKKRDKKEEAQTLDTSALLRKKNQRQQQ